MKAIRDGGVTDVEWPTVVEVIAGSVASVDSRVVTFGVSPRYADSLMRPNHFKPHRDLVGPMLAAGSMAGVVSLNYDLLAEKTIRPHPTHRPPTPGFYYGGLPTPQVCVGRSSSPFGRDRRREPLGIQGSIPIFKPHGSLNWHRIPLDPDRSHIVIHPDLRAAFRGRGEAAIVPPIEVEATVPAWLRTVWAGAERLLASVDRWVVVGYSLPDADEALRALLVRAVAAGNLSRITVHNRTDRTKPRWVAVAGDVPVVFAPPLLIT